jgi:hypothetical protein
MPTCTHLDQVQITLLPESVEGCEECLAAGDPWLHLRICLVCGRVGCCDDSPNRHASAHARTSGHPEKHASPRRPWAASSPGLGPQQISGRLRALGKRDLAEVDRDYEGLVERLAGDVVPHLRRSG